MIFKANVEDLYGVILFKGGMKPNLMYSKNAAKSVMVWNVI